jgi:glycosyltransferase involved in cell wall biosynthesis
MKKLAMVVTQAEMGGAQKNILLLAKCLRRDYDITVYSGEAGALIKELENIGVRHITVPDLVREINLVKDFKAYSFLLKEFKTQGYHIVHCHSSKAGILARQAAKGAKIHNSIYTAHGFVFNEPMSSLKRDLYIFLEKLQGKNCHSIICVNSHDVVTAEIQGIKPRRSLMYVPNGMDFSNDLCSADKSLKEHQVFTFGLIANFYETKGHRYLIEAFNNFSSSASRKVRLVLIGDGILRPEMERLAEGNPNIEFWGYRDKAEELMGNFHCFILSSVKEGFPFVILEAVKNRLPVISTDVGAVREILNEGKNGILVEKASAESLEKAMAYVLEHQEEMAEKAEAAFEFCKERYSIERMVELTRKVYES